MVDFLPACPGNKRDFTKKNVPRLPSNPSANAAMSITHAQAVVKDLTICIFSTVPPSIFESDSRTWHRIEKDLHLYTSQESAWLYVMLAKEDELAAEDLLVTDISIGDQPPNSSSDRAWESRPGGIWVLRDYYSGMIDQAVTGVDVLFGRDAVDPRSQWILMRSPIRLDVNPDVPVARLSIVRGRVKPRPAPTTLRVKNGKFKIVQISDTHMVTGGGVCEDAIDAHGNHLPASEADPLTVNFIEKILDIERPDLVVLAGDQVHHDVSDSQSALFKVVAPIIERSIPFAAVFGNHDSEGAHALPRE